MPCRGFKWLNQGEIDVFDANLIEENSPIGDTLEVDLEYPDEVHELHNDYLIVPERLEISHDMLLNYCSNIADKYWIKFDGADKLIKNLCNKSKCVLHYRNRQLYLSLGMKLVKVHRILKFKQSHWLKKYIDFNTDKRKNAASSFEKYFFKLMNDSSFDKTMKNLRKRTNVRLVNNAGDSKKCVSKPNFVSQETFSKNFVAFHEIKPGLALDKPIYVGFSILDLSKFLMYEFHYEYVKKI